LSLFQDHNISQGSVATPLRYDEILKNYAIANLPVNLLVQEFLKSISIWQSYRKSL